MITNETLLRFKNAFHKHVDSFIFKEDFFQNGIESKREHTIRVAENSRLIAESLNMSQEEKVEAEVAGLFHDIGRFSQLFDFKTFVDRKSVDHGELGVNVLKEKKLLSILSEETRNNIYAAVANHNKAYIAENLSFSQKHLTKIVRDADKLDIFKLASQHYQQKHSVRDPAFELGLQDEPFVTREVIEALENKCLIQIEHMNCLNDFKLLQIGWVYDINFKYTYQVIYEKRYLDIIFDSLTFKDPALGVFKHIKAFLREKAGRIN